MLLSQTLLVLMGMVLLVSVAGAAGVNFAPKPLLAPTLCTSLSVVDASEAGGNVNRRTRTGR